MNKAKGWISDLEDKPKDNPRTLYKRLRNRRYVRENETEDEGSPRVIKWKLLKERKQRRELKIRETRKTFPKLKNERFQSEGAHRMPNQISVITSRTRCMPVKALNKRLNHLWVCMWEVSRKRKHATYRGGRISLTSDLATSLDARMSCKQGRLYNLQGSVTMKMWDFTIKND